MDIEGSGPGPHSSLLGRSGECALLDELLFAIRRGEGRALVLWGEAGIGKTALLEYLVESAPDVRVVRAVGVESEMELAYASMHQLCGPLFDRREMLPDPQQHALETVFGLSAGSAPDPFLVGLAVLSLITNAAEERPLLCVADDAQWLDQASSRTLAFVARRLLAEPVGLIVASREPGPELRNLPEMHVHGLHNDDAHTLLNSVVPIGLSDRVREQIVAETRGNPLALLELPRGLTEPQLAGGFGVLGADGLSGRIEESFLRRLNSLSARGRRLLLLAAAEPVGDPLLLWSAAERLDIWPPAADELVAQALLAIGDRVIFRHPLVRSAVYRSAEAPQRREIHLALAEATDRTADPDRRAWHLAAAAAGPDEEVALELERSAIRAQARGGLASTAGFLRRAVALTADPQRRVDRVLAAAEANLQAGEFDVARSLVDTAEPGPHDELRSARVELLRGRIALFSSPGPGASLLLLRAAQHLEAVDVRVARDTYLDAWGAALYAGRLSSRGTLLEVSRAAKAAPEPHGPPEPADLLLDCLATLVTEGRAAAAPLLEQVTRTFADEQLPEAESLRWGWLTVVPAYVLWDEEATHSLCERQLHALRDAGALARLPLDLGTFSRLALQYGDLAGAAAAVAETHAITEATGTAVAPFGEMMLATFRGREDEAGTLIKATKRQSLALGQGIALQIADWMLAMLCNGLGRYDEALASAQEASNDNPGEIIVSDWAAVELLEAAHRSDSPELAHIALERIIAATAAARSESARGMEARCRALMNEGRTAERLYREAIERLGQSRLRPEVARAHLLYGEWLRREGRRMDARGQLRAAYEEFTSIGMEAFAERARGELLATGEKVRRGTAEARDELTTQERQIAHLAATGLSNPEIGTRLFLSPRTVEYHLSKVFPKLGINSRKDLAAALSANGR